MEEDKIKRFMIEKRASLEDLIEAKREVLLVLAEEISIDDAYLSVAKDIDLGWDYSYEYGFKVMMKSRTSGDLTVRALDTNRKRSFCNYSTDSGEVVKSSVNLHYFLNNPEGAIEELSDGMRHYMKLMYKSFGDSSHFPKKSLNKVHIDTFVRVKETNGLDQIESVLSKVSKKHLMKIEMPGLVSDFGDFYKFYRVGSDVSMSKIIPARMTTPKEVIKKKVAFLAEKLNSIYSFPYGDITDVNNFARENENLSAEFVESMFVKELKNMASSRMSDQSLLSNLLTIIPQVKSREFRKLQEIDELGKDEMFIDKLTSSFDTFFLSRSFVKDVFKFNQNSASEPSNYIQEKGLKFLFDCLTEKSMQPVSSIISSRVASVGDLFHIVVEGNAKYKRENIQESLSYLVANVKRIAENNPLSTYDLEEGFDKSKWNGVDRGTELETALRVLKDDKKLSKVINKAVKNQSKEDREPSQPTQSFKL